MLMPINLYAQCDGNIGANIFESGDFGSGRDNILQSDPNIAPGYQFTTDVPPFDGFYTITNDLADWDNSFDCWLDIEDQSNDPNGYMMIVNASYSPGLFYQETVDGLCESTGYEFSADVLNLLRSSCDQLDPNVSFLINNVVFFQTGPIDETDIWQTFGFSFETDPGETSITLSLRNNAPGGFGNDLALDNITFRPCGPEALILPEEIANICEDGDPITIDATVLGDQYDNPQFQWQQSFDEGVTWTNIVGENGATYSHTDLNGGSYYYRYLLANSPEQLDNSKCRVFSNTKVIYVQPKFYNETLTICEGTSTIIDGQVVNTAGDYVANLLTSIGCDSIVTITLDIVPDLGIEAQITPIQPICFDSNNGSVQIIDIQNVYEPYQVFVNGEIIANFTEITLPPDRYEISIIDTFNCSFTEDIVLELPDPDTFEIGDDVTLSLGDELIINPISNIQNPSYTGSLEYDCNSDCSELTLLPFSTHTLIINVTDEKLCAMSDTLMITVTKDRKVYIPNIFCPSCIHNNRFFIQGAQPNISSIHQLSIFDRYGNIIYQCSNGQPNNPDCGWDGTFNDQIVSPGVYIYVVEVEFIDGEVIPFSGDITLIR